MITQNMKEIFESTNGAEKINIIRTYENTSESDIIKLIIEALDDPDIQVRGEAFSSLMINKNKIANILIDSLKDSRKNIRGFSALILANRNDIRASPNIIELTKDKSSMVRSCALGSLGHMKIKEAVKEIHECFSDPNLEVRKSALKAAIDIDDLISNREYKTLSMDKDEEMEFLLSRIMKDGPGGI